MKMSKLNKPFNVQEDTGAPFTEISIQCTNISTIDESDKDDPPSKKISYERRAYESVDEKRLS